MESLPEQYVIPQSESGNPYNQDDLYQSTSHTASLTDYCLPSSAEYMPLEGRMGLTQLQI